MDHLDCITWIGSPVLGQALMFWKMHQTLLINVYLTFTSFIPNACVLTCHVFPNKRRYNTIGKEKQFRMTVRRSASTPRK